MGNINGLELPYGVKILNPTPVDAWSGPYDNISSALQTIPSEVRFLTMSVRVTGSSNGSQIYWFKDSTEDAGLVVFDGSGIFTGGTINGNIFLSGSTIYGDGSGLYNIQASGITGLNLNEISYDNNSAVISSSGFTVNCDSNFFGDIISNKFILKGGTGSHILLDDGNFLPITIFDSKLNNTGGTINGNLNINGNMSIVGSLLSNMITGTTISGGTFYGNGSNLTNVNSMQLNSIPSSGYSLTSHTHYQLYQSNGTNPFVYTDNNGNLHIDGGIIQSGSTYETHAEQIYTTKDYIYLRSGATYGISDGNYSGFEIINYDGTTNGRLVIDNSGTARVGDSGDEQPLATREEVPIDSGLTIWSSAAKKFTTLSASIKTGYDNASNWVTTNGSTLLNHIADTTIHVTSSLQTYWNNIGSWVDTNGSTILAHLTNTNNPHNVTRLQLNAASSGLNSDITGLTTISSIATPNGTNLGFYYGTGLTFAMSSNTIQGRTANILAIGSSGTPCAEIYSGAFKSGASNLSYSTGGNYNHIFWVNSVQTIIISSSAIYPYTSGVTSSGTLTNPWSNSFTNAITLNAAISSSNGSQTINKSAGRFPVSAATSSVTITNSYVTANSIVFCQPSTNDSTGRVLSVVPSAGAFTVYLTAPTSQMYINFLVIN